MGHVRPRIPPLLADDRLRRIHAAALETIERVGMYCDRPDVLDRLRDTPGARVEGDRIFLRAVEEIYARAEEHFRQGGTNP